MSTHHIDCAAMLSMAPSKKLVMLCLADGADKLTRKVSPGLENVMQWSGLKKSRTLEVIAELVTEGLVTRVTAGQPGRLAEFVVFPNGCCALHGPMKVAAVEPAGRAPGRGSAGPDPRGDGSDPGHGSAGPDPLESGSDPVRGSDSGSGNGSGNGSALDRTLPVSPVSPVSTERGSVEGVRHQREDDVDEPSPSTPDGISRTCQAHRLTPAPGPCPPCGDWRRAADVAENQARALSALRATEARIEAAEAKRRARELTDAEVGACKLCDASGRLPSGLACLHDERINPSPEAGGFAAFQALRAKGVARSTDGRDPEKGRRRAQAERSG